MPVELSIAIYQKKFGHTDAARIPIEERVAALRVVVETRERAAAANMVEIMVCDDQKILWWESRTRKDPLDTRVCTFESRTINSLTLYLWYL